VVAILWEKQQSGHRYQVRRAGKSLRLYTDNIFHTQYRPDRALGGGYWDLLSLAALLYPEGSIRRVLVLGVGGGAVIHSLRALVNPSRITGVELDPVHVQIMKKFFLFQGKGSDPFVDLKVMDARDFVRQYSKGGTRKPKFDLIIEDLYFERNGGAIRAVVMDKAWMTALRRCLAPDGMLVCNFEDNRQFRKTLPLAKWQGIYAMTLPAYENCIGVYVRRRELMMDIPAVVNKLAAMDKRISTKSLRFSLKQVQ
jgi:predicted membrane-bound spermidine synthase